MRIAINALLLKNKISGVEVYIHNLIKEIQKTDSVNTYFIFINEKLELNKDLLTKDNFVFKVIKNASYSFWRTFYEQLILPRELIRLNIDVFHSPIFILPLECAVKSIVTVHDLSFKIYPEFIPYYKSSYYNLFVKRSLNKANRIIAISRNTKQDLLKLFNIPEEKIEVIHYGLDPFLKPLAKNLAKNKTIENFGIKDDFILYVGRIDPRKNLSQLIRAYYQIKKKEDIKHKLVIAGAFDWLYKDILDLVKKLCLENEVVFLGHTESEKLVYLYNAASIFVYPSLYEGFGLPVLEAMACGVPVITSNNSSLEEIASDAALLINPYHVEELSEAITRLLRDGSLKDTLVHKGLEKVKEFSWQRNALKTKELYEEISIN